jgi:hypothetical protein
MGVFADCAWKITCESHFFKSRRASAILIFFLPVALNSPRFIPSDIAQKHQIPHSSFALIVKDAQDTFNNLIGLSDTVIFSYAKTHFESEQQPSPLLKFNNETQVFKYEYQNVALKLLSDAQANPLLDMLNVSCASLTSNAKLLCVIWCF